MARVVKQTLPAPPPVYDQTYIAQLTNAINRYMVQRESLGELITARVIMTDPPRVSASPGPGDYPDTSQLPNGTVYLKDIPGTPKGTYFLTVVTPEDV